MCVQEKQKPQTQSPMGHQCQKKGWEECGRNRAPLGGLSYNRSETSCICMWTQGCLPITALNYQQSHTSTGDIPPQEGKNHHLPCLLLPLYTERYMGLWWRTREQRTRTATLQHRFDMRAVSKMQDASTVLNALWVPVQGRSTTSFSTCRPRLDETALWHTLSGPPDSTPGGAASRGLAIAKANNVPDEAFRQDVSLQKFPLPTQPRK